jgi:hypothetical protein
MLQMVVAVIVSLAKDNGSSQDTITHRIEAEAHGDLRASHPTLIAAHLARMSAAVELIAILGGKYALPPSRQCRSPSSRRTMTARMRSRRNQSRRRPRAAAAGPRKPAPELPHRH